MAKLFNCQIIQLSHCQITSLYICPLKYYQKNFMVQRIVKIVALSVILFYLPVQSFAWGVLGHRITGQVADSYLSAKARKAIKKILGNESLAMAANYADFIKSDSTYKYIDNWHYVNIDSGLTAQQIQLKLQNDTNTNIYNRIIFFMCTFLNAFKGLIIRKFRSTNQPILHHQPIIFDSMFLHDHSYNDNLV